jgi:glycerol-3-phosphate O-acyltransferase
MMLGRLTILAALSSSTVSGWVFPVSKYPTLRTVVSSTAIESEEKGTSTASPELSSPFQAALDVATAKLDAYIPEDKKAMAPLLIHFVTEYMGACQDAFAAGKKDCAPDVAAERFLTGIKYGLAYGTGENKYLFDVTHNAIRGKDEKYPIDFYAFGVDFFRPCMSETTVLGKDTLDTIMKQVEAGENVVFFANHQSEADPQVVSVCLENAGFLKAAEDMVYVAGHKVTTDPLAIPFSMGRNLICIHSKKHIDFDPSTKPVKQRQNMRAINGLLDKFKKGGALVWVAPSGGRDRRDLDTGKVPIAPFDSKTIDIFRLMGSKSKVKTHYYTLAMVTYDLCPPPDFIEPGVGEPRNVRYVPVGIAVGKEVESKGGLEARHDFCVHAEAQCDQDYKELLDSMH